MSNKVRMFGPLGNSSGYGNAVRNFALAFSKSEIPTKFQFGKAAEENHANFLAQLNNFSGETNVDFYLHGPPWSKHRSSAYKIAYFYWEADRLPLTWEKMINQVDEIWAPCPLVEKACKRAKFKGPIKIVPTPVDPHPVSRDLYIPSPFSGDLQVSKEVFKFYSIFQWHERKGFRELLTAYFKTFQEKDQVLLILKVNPLKVGNYTSEQIKRDILSIKKKLNQKFYPRLYLSKEILKEEYIFALHQMADCYVSAHHGEGWGVPIHDAILAGNHLITTPFGGVTEYLNDSSANFIDFKLGPVAGMDWSPLYGNYQNWAYPSISSLSLKMREIYEKEELYRYKIKNAQEIAEKMETEQVAKIISQELSQKRKK